MFGRQPIGLTREPHVPVDRKALIGQRYRDQLTKVEKSPVNVGLSTPIQFTDQLGHPAG